MLIMDDMAGRKALIEASGLKTGRVLDVGMGNCGCMAFFLASNGFHVVGIDNSPEAVSKSRQDAKKERFIGTFEAQVANGEHLPFESYEFDAVIAYHALHHMENVEQVVVEMFRVCKPLGFVLIADLNENGCKAYQHKWDDGKLMKNIECCLIEYSPTIQKVETEYNLMFICQK
jgi:ubiquinone/menaquinone biosynthesis C-methylase UbiE